MRDQILLISAVFVTLFLAPCAYALFYFGVI